MPFVADLDDLERVVAELASCGTDLGALLDEVDAGVAALHLTWSGAAADAHRAAQATWRAGFREMREALDLLRCVGQVAHDNYDAAARANVAMWGQVR
ncbi:WXG100 family type VII secretion target [Nocardioides sp. KIGAM211]|uniref:ESAT-6-like protein n=1 Tax=Nocardioides luti TaxID=2761101 RepID=A0A7X0RF56_9ACTN|nr:WXG100 family type VII secretion target [Nocardioides luti]MBB6627142.1 WXG100 family type VII secretion target [Nocardioides luti]